MRLRNLMRHVKVETTAVILTVIGVFAALGGPFLHEQRVANPKDYDRIVTLTGIARTGVWTEAEVTGGNYWLESFPRARPRLRVGERVLLRLKSADVVHNFYLPAMGVGPVEVYPGHVSEVPLIARDQGVYEYYCTAVCGDPHFAMRGEVLVENGHTLDVEPEPREVEEYWKTPPPPAGSSRMERGRWLFRRWGCVACHGEAGKGGVPNFNYVKDTIPPLNTLAEKMMLFYPEDAAAIIDALEAGTAMETLAEDPPIARFNVFLAQYDSVRKVILNGNPPGKKDPHGPRPPLEMLPWGQRLSSDDVDSLLAYLLTLQEWDE